jgi:superfamily II DNA or RNA helicase
MEKLNIYTSNRIIMHMPKGALSQSTNDFLSVVKSENTIPNPAYQEAQKRGRWLGRISSVIPLVQIEPHGISLPRGYAYRLLQLAKHFGVEYCFEDVRRELPMVLYRSKIQLRPYQKIAVEGMLKGTQGVLVSPAGSGKTESMLEVIARVGQPAIWLTHTKELAEQAAARAESRLGILRSEIGMIGDGTYRVGEMLTIGILQTLCRMDLKKLAGLFGLLMLDECFPAGTLIDGKPIESIKLGNVVTAWDERNQQVTQGIVAETLKRRAPSLLVRVHASGKNVVCTPNHPFLTKDGWREAIGLNLGEELLYEACSEGMPEVWQSKDDKPGIRIMQKMQGRNNSIQQQSVCSLQLLQKNCCNFGKSEKRSVSGYGANLLFGTMQESIPARSQFQDHDQNQQEVRFGHDGQQRSTFDTGNEGQTECFPQSQGMEATNSGRQWSRANSAASQSCQRLELANRTNSSNEDKETQQISDLLQDRHCQFRVEDRNRDRWPLSFCPQTPRSEEGYLPVWLRVDNIEILQPGSDGTFGGLCPDGHVYNFEVADYHTYTANGFIVHNCAHCPAETYAAVVDQFPARWRYGCSAQIVRSDGLEVLTERFIGPILHTVPRTAVELSGGVIVPRLRTIKTETVSESFSQHVKRTEEWERLCGEARLNNTREPRKPQMNYNAIMSDVINDSERNHLIIQTLIQECPGHFSLVLSERVDHCQGLNAILQQTFPELRSDIVHGKLAAKKRETVIESMKSGNLDVLFAVDLAKEGLDIPRLDRLFLVAGGNNEAETEQKVGRIQRGFSGKRDAFVFDFVDECIPVLAAQFWTRKKVYQRLGMIGNRERQVG